MESTAEEETCSTDTKLDTIEHANAFRIVVKPYNGKDDASHGSARVTTDQKDKLKKNKYG